MYNSDLYLYFSLVLTNKNKFYNLFIFFFLLSECHPETLLHWLKRQISHYNTVPPVEDVTLSFKSGLALCSIIHRYRPHLIDFASLNPEDVAKNNQLAFDILEKEAAIPPVSLIFTTI